MFDDDVVQTAGRQLENSNMKTAVRLYYLILRLYYIPGYTGKFLQHFR